MTDWAKRSLKRSLNAIGSRLSRSALSKADSVLNYLHTGRWMRDHGFKTNFYVKDRTTLIQAVAAPIASEEILYMEFGVWRGESMHQWSKLLTNPRSRLHGFDSFEGLPEDWNAEKPKGLFSTHGNIPVITDDRVKFFKGWFENTLPQYTFTDSPVLIIYLDADLYSSTAYVLNALRDRIKAGTIVCFDEFTDRNHEQRAFGEFLCQSKMKFELVACDYGMIHVAFRRMSPTLME